MSESHGTAWGVEDAGGRYELPDLGVDTNVLARLVLGDDAEQAAAAEQTLAHAIARGQSILIAPTVWLELEWVLRSRARLDRERIAATFDAILETEGFVFPEWPAVEQALAWYRDDQADFADALHAALYARHGARMLTFDQTAAARLPTTRRIGSGEAG
ncbi:MAG: type II toxin-antitoxin system VapC family toxin [Casimicrobiaceae bacterium]|nr:type II toxin-antitoxin system VapC family toxin [Casimicrobiaceae bacterium]